jgi:chromosome partitioning protein
MFTIVTSSFKGGTAKTSATLNLAAALCYFHKKKCLLIDFDPQANLTSSIGFSPDDMNTIVPVLQDEKRLKEVIKNTCIPNLDIVTANTYLDQIESTPPLISDPYAHERLRNNLKDVQDEYDFCFIDIPPSLNWLCRSAFYASNYSLICAIPEPFSVLAMQRLAKYHDSINRNHQIGVLGVLLSFWDERSSINEALLMGIELAFKDKILETKIRRDKAIPKSVLDGKPVFLTEKSSRASKDYQALADEVVKKIESLNCQPVGAHV